MGLDFYDGSFDGSLANNSPSYNGFRRTKYGFSHGVGMETMFAQIETSASATPLL
jgi:hypothetical protein